MKSYILSLGVAISSVLLTASFQANAATSVSAEAKVVAPSIANGGTAEFKMATGTNLLFTNQQGWVSPTMSFKGWTHHTKWIFLDVTKGKTVTINVDAVTPNDNTFNGFHPGVTVWSRNAKKPANDNSNHWLDDHFYKQAASINVKNAKQDSGSPKPGESVGDIVMNYITSAYDADGLGDLITVDGKTYGPYMPYQYSVLSGSNGIVGSKPTAIPPVDDKGKVSLTFTAPKTGVYQIAVGGLKPDVGSVAAAPKSASCTPALPTGTRVTEAACTAANGTYDAGTVTKADVTITVQ